MYIFITELKLVIDFFHVLNMLKLSAFNFARPDSFGVTYSFDFKVRECIDLTGKFEWRQKIIYTVKKVYSLIEFYSCRYGDISLPDTV